MQRFDPIVIYQMGKVGFKTIQASLEKLNLPNKIYHTHFLSWSNIKQIEDHYSSIPGTNVRLDHCKDIRSLVDSTAGNIRWKIITLVRDPVARDISDVFHNIKRDLPHVTNVDPESAFNDISSHILKTFADFNESTDYACTWFDKEIKDVFNFDIYANDFNKSTGYQIYRVQDADILLIRLEDLSRCCHDAFREFLGVPDFSMVKDNVSEKKWYQELYRRVLDSISIPDSDLERIYKSRYCRHFYTGDEINHFKKKWSGEKTEIKSVTVASSQRNSSNSGKILIVHPEGNINNNPNLTGIVEILCENGYKVDICSLRRSNIYQYSWCAGASLFLLDRPENLVENGTFILEDPKLNSQEKIISYINENFKSYDLVIGVDRGIIEAALIAQNRQIPCGLISYEIFFEEETSREFKQEEIEACKCLDFIVCQDALRAKYLSIENNIALEKIINIPVAGRGIKKGEKNSYLYDSLGINKDKKIALFMGTVAPWSMAGGIPESAKLWSEDWVLVVHSRYGLDRHVRPYYEKYKHLDNIYFSLEPIADPNKMHKIIHSADIGIAFYEPTYQSKYTGNNIKYLGMASGKIATYLQHGLPIIINEIGQLSDYVRKYGLGLVVDDNGNFSTPLTDGQLLKFRLNCLEFFEKRLDLNHTIVPLLKIIQRLFDKQAVTVSSENSLALGTKDFLAGKVEHPVINSAEKYNLSGEELLGRKDIDGALNAFKKAIEVAPHFIAAHNNIGKAYLQKGELANALKHFTNALKINPYDLATVLNCGQVLTSHGLVQEVKSLYRSYLRENPNDNKVIHALESLNCERRIEGRDDVTPEYKKDLIARTEHVAMQQNQGDIENRKYLVSAIVSMYNSQRFIRGCLDDLVGQTLFKKGELEIVVVNSGSQQNEDAVVRELQQKYDNIKYIRTDQRETVYQAWNRGIKTATGKYITNANTDDRLREDAYERKIQILENNPHIGVIYADQWISEVPNEKFRDCKKERGLIWPEFFPELGISVCIFGSQPMWRRDLHEKYGLFDERFKSAGDFEFWSRVSDKVECRHIPDFLGVYYSNPDGIEKSYGHNASETKQIRQQYSRGLKNTKSRLSLFSDLTSVFHKIRIFRNQAKTAKHRSDVSVIIPMYNSSKYIVETLESIIQQTANNFEIVMVDDGSIDDCVQKAIKCLEKTDIPATILSIPHRGPTVARNIGVFYSTGQFILPFDSDDIMMPEMVADFHNKLSSDTSLGFAYCDVEYFEDMQKIRSMGDVDINNFMWENQAHACSMFRKTAWVDASGYYAKMKYGDEDWDLWLEMLEKGWKACHIPKPNFRYRWRKKSRTSKLVSEHWAHMKSQLVLNHPDMYPEVYRRWAALENKSHYESLTVREMTYLLLLYCAELPRWRNIYWWTEAKKKLCSLMQMPIDDQQLESRLEEMSKLIDFNIQVKSNGRLTKKDKKVEVIEYARKPEISVIIPLYNHERFIEMAISSVLEQSFPDFELIIINDGSTDNSAKIVKKFNDNRIRYVSRANKGAYETINEGVRLAKGKYISILNSDDFYDKDRLKKCVNILKNNRSLAAVFSYINIIDGHGNLMDSKEGDKSNWGKIKNKITFENQVNPLLSLLAGNFLVTTSNLFCKKEIFNKIGYFRNLRYTHDYDMFLRICQNFKTYILPELLLFYRLHSSNSFKENRAQVCFEVGLLLTDFLLNNDIFHKNGIEGYYEFITKFYNSINTYGADRMILTLLVMAKYDEKFKNIFFNELIDNENNLFRKSCIDEFRKILSVTSAVPKELPSTLEAENDKTPQGLEIGPRKQKERLKEIDEIRNKYSGMLLSSWPSTVRSPDNESELKVLQDRKRTAVSPCVPHTPAKIKVALFRSYFTKPLYTALVSYPQIDAVLVDDLEEMIEMLRGHELEAVVTPSPELKQHTPKSIFSFLINHGLADKNYTSHPSKIDGHNAYLVAGQALRERALQTGLYDEKYLQLVGYLPFDYLFTGEFSDSKKFLEEMNLDLSKKTVLYAPTWNGLGNYSSLFSDGEQIVKAVSEKYNLIIKYHWNIPREIEQKKQGFEQFHLIKQYAEKRKNTRIISGTQILKCINACNVLIGDTSSVILEAMCLDKPVIFWDKAGRRPLYGIDKEARNAGVSVKSRTGLKNAVELSMANPRYLSENRKKIAARASLPIDGKCGQRAARAVYEILAQKTSKRALALKNNNANLTGHVKCLTSNLALK